MHSFLEIDSKAPKRVENTWKSTLPLLQICKEACLDLHKISYKVIKKLPKTSWQFIKRHEKLKNIKKIAWSLIKPN